MASKDESQLKVVLSLAAIGLAGILSMYATWFAISRYPIPDSDAINLGLAGFFLVVFLDIFFVCGFIINDLRNGKRRSLREWAVNAAIFVGGLLAAAVLGLFLWCFWLFQAKHWAFYVFQTLFCVWLAALSWRRLWRRRRGLSAGQDSHRSPSLGAWIGLGSSVILMIFGFLGFVPGDFSKGQTWVGVWRIAMALLLGLPATEAVMEIWRRRRSQAA